MEKCGRALPLAADVPLEVKYEYTCGCGDASSEEGRGKPEPEAALDCGRILACGGAAGTGAAAALPADAGAGRLSPYLDGIC